MRVEAGDPEGRSALGVGVVHVGVVLQQERRHVELAQLGGEVERRLPAEIAGVDLEK